MEGKSPGNEYLQLARRFDLENGEHRRLAVYALHDFCGVIMTQLGREIYQLENLHAKKLPTQWGEIRGEIQSNNDTDIPENYNSFPGRVSNYTGRIRHNFLEIPPQKEIEELRKTAEEWRDWNQQQAEKYIGGWKIIDTDSVQVDIESDKREIAAAWKNKTTGEELRIETHPHYTGATVHILVVRQNESDLAEFGETLSWEETFSKAKRYMRNHDQFPEI